MLAASDIADRFELGEPASDLTVVPGGSTHRLYRLSTETGTWAVKILNRTHEDWWMEGFEASTQLEEAAVRGGIRAPHPIVPRDPIPRYMAELRVNDSVLSVRVHEWVDGQKPITPVGMPLAHWMTETSATLANLDLSHPGKHELAYRTHGVEEWRSWMDEADGKGLDVAPQLRDALPLILDASSLASAVHESGFPFQLLHRDFTPWNVLVADDGAFLLDWDSAGPDIPWLDFLRSLWRFAGFPSSSVDSALVVDCVERYVDSGGSQTGDDIAFAGLINGVLEAMSFFLWRALGHRPVTPDEQRTAEAIVAGQLNELREIMRSLDDWQRLLG